jgi:hypothetical protein
VARRARKVLALDGAALVVESGSGKILGHDPAAITALLRRAGFGDVAVAADAPGGQVVVARPESESPRPAGHPRPFA